MSNELILKQLAERRQNIWEGAKALLDTAATENRDLSAEESVSYDKMSADLTSLRSRIDSIVATDEANRSAEASLTKALGTPDQRNAGAPDLETNLRSWLSGETNERTFGVDAKEMRSSWARIERRDLGSYSNFTAAPTAGGNTVPTSFYDNLVEHLVDTSGLLSGGPTVLNTTSGESIQIPKTTSHGSAGIIGQAQAIAESDPAFGMVTLGAFKYGQIVQISRELLDDTAVDILGYIARSAGRNLGLALGAHLISGTGTNQPTGLATVTTLGVTSATSVVGVPSADNLIDLFFSVIPPYRNSPSAAWLMKDSTIAAVRKLKDTTNQYLWQPGLVGGAPDTLLGKPVRPDVNMAATGLNAKSIAFGDLSAYYLRLAGGVRFERSDDFAFNTDQVTFRAVLRADGNLVDTTGAVKHFVGAAS